MGLERELWGGYGVFYGAGREQVERGPLKSMGRPDGRTATVGLGGSVGPGGIYGAGAVVVGLEGFLWGWGGSCGVAMGCSMGLGGSRWGDTH